MNRILETFATETEIFQGFQRESSLRCPMVTLGGCDSSGDVVGKPVPANKWWRILPTELLLVKQLLGQVEVVDEEEIPAKNGDGGQGVGSHLGVEHEVQHSFLEVEEGKAAKERELWGAWWQLLPFSQEEYKVGGKKQKEEEEKANDAHGDVH